MGEVILITSGKGGTGKSTLTANLGAALASYRKRVLLLDLDIGMGALDILMGYESKVVFNLSDILDGNCKIIRALVPSETYPTLFFLPASKTRDISSVPLESFGKLIAIFKKEFDFVLIDGPAGFRDGLRNPLFVSDRVITVSTPDSLSLRAAKRIKTMLPFDLGNKIFLVINRLRLDLLREDAAINPEDFVAESEIPLLGVITESDDILSQPMTKAPVINVNTVACRAFLNIARRMQGEKVPIVLKGK